MLPKSHRRLRSAETDPGVLRQHGVVVCCCEGWGSGRVRRWAMDVSGLASRTAAHHRQSALGPYGPTRANSSHCAGGIHAGGFRTSARCCMRRCGSSRRSRAARLCWCTAQMVGTEHRSFARSRRSSSTSTTARSTASLYGFEWPPSLLRQCAFGCARARSAARVPRFTVRIFSPFHALGYSPPRRPIARCAMRWAARRSADESSHQAVAA